MRYLVHRCSIVSEGRTSWYRTVAAAGASPGGALAAASSASSEDEEEDASEEGPGRRDPARTSEPVGSPRRSERWTTPTGGGAEVERPRPRRPGRPGPLPQVPQGRRQAVAPVLPRGGVPPLPRAEAEVPQGHDEAPHRGGVVELLGGRRGADAEQGRLEDVLRLAVSRVPPNSSRAVASSPSSPAGAFSPSGTRSSRAYPSSSPSTPSDFFVLTSKLQSK